MRASALALLAALSVAVPATSAPSRPERTATLTFKLVTMNGQRRVLSRHAIDPYTYSLSPDHKKLAYIPQRAEGERDAPVMLADVRSPRERVLVDTGCPFLGVSWAPSGRMLAVDTSTGAYCYDRAGLWFVNPDGTGFRQVDEGGAPLVWSSDSRFLADSRPISVFSLETHETHVLDEGYGPAWSPNGSEIAYTHNAGMYVASVATGEVRGLTRGWKPSWSPDGRRIAFIRYVRDANHLHMWVMSSRGGKPRRLARGLAPFAPLVWSPKGRQLAYVKGRSLFARTLSGRGRRLLTSEDGDITPLAWSRDGGRVLYYTLTR
jgi:Tol biopolymer transport system component